MRSIFFLCVVVGCGGGAAFQSATIDGVDGGAGAGGAEASLPDAPPATGDDAPSSRSDAPADALVAADATSEAPGFADALTADATSEAPGFVDVAQREATPETSSPPPDTAAPPTVDAGELADAHDEPKACDLKPCICAPGIYYALCCNGPCPAGFEGMTCYCGRCLPPSQYVPDAGACVPP